MSFRPSSYDQKIGGWVVDEPLLDLGRARIVKGRGLYVQLPVAERLRAARRVPQAIVKVRSFARGTTGVQKIMSYISRKGSLPLEKESGEIVQDLAEQRQLIKDWAIDFDSRKNSRDTAHIIFSMPPGSNAGALRRAVRATAPKAFPDHEWVFAIHEDKKHPHAHLVLKMRGRNQEKILDFKKSDLHKLREHFAEAAREQGVELAASPRAARGIGGKGIRQAIYQFKKAQFLACNDCDDSEKLTAMETEARTESESENGTGKRK